MTERRVNDDALSRRLREDADAWCTPPSAERQDRILHTLRESRTVAPFPEAVATTSRGPALALAAALTLAAGAGLWALMNGSERPEVAPAIAHRTAPAQAAPKHAVPPQQWLTLVDRASDRMQEALRDSSMNRELVALETDIRGISDSLRRRAATATMGLIRE